MTSLHQFQHASLDQIVADQAALGNLRGLEAAFGVSVSAPQSLEWMLRHHSEAPIVNPDEIEFRDRLDNSLAALSTLEVAAIAGVIPAQPQNDWLWVLPKILTQPAVEMYFSKHYRLRLIELFRDRVSGTRDFVEAGRHPETGVFSAFTALSSSLTDDPDVKTLLLMLDDFVIAGKREADLRKAVGDWPTFYQALINAASRRSKWPTDSFYLSYADPVDRACRGLVSFLDFAQHFASLLRRCERLPVTSAAMWHHHSYWFRELQQDLGEVLGLYQNAGIAAIDQFATDDKEFMFARQALQARVESAMWLFNPSLGDSLR